MRTALLVVVAQMAIGLTGCSMYTGGCCDGGWSGVFLRNGMLCRGCGNGCSGGCNEGCNDCGDGCDGGCDSGCCSGYDSNFFPGPIGTARVKQAAGCGNCRKPYMGMGDIALFAGANRGSRGGILGGAGRVGGMQQQGCGTDGCGTDGNLCDGCSIADRMAGRRASRQAQAQMRRDEAIAEAQIRQAEAQARREEAKAQRMVRREIRREKRAASMNLSDECCDDGRQVGGLFGHLFSGDAGQRVGSGCRAGGACCGCGGRGCGLCAGKSPAAQHPYGGQVPHTDGFHGQPGPLSPTYAYPYYTTRGPRDYFADKPNSIGP